MKLLSKDDAEASLFWALLDEAQGEDGCSFISYCLSVALSIGGTSLWQQFGASLSRCQGIHAISSNIALGIVSPVIWLHLKTAREAVRIIFVKALEAQIREALDAIDALKEAPPVDNPLVMEENVQSEESALMPDTSSRTLGAAVVDGGVDTLAVVVSQDDEHVEAKKDPIPTHVNLFSWLRIMLYRYQIERSQRAAAVRLMFETASIGALTPHSSVAPGNDDGLHVEFPQFQAVMRTLSPHVPVVEVANLYSTCYDEGNKRVTSDVFLKVAERRGIFSKWLKLPSLPLLEDRDPVNNPDTSDDEQGLQAKAVGDLELSGEAPNSQLFPSAEARIAIVPLSVAEPTDTSEAGVITAEAKLRVGLGAVIHRKISSLMPELNILMTSLPERWRCLVKDGIDAVNNALKDSWFKQKKRDTGYGSQAELQRARVGNHIDGLQPFIHYQRLLSTALMVRSVTCNPLLPGELFRGTRENLLPSVSLDMHKAEKLLSKMEEAIINYNFDPEIKSKKYFRLDNVRKSFHAKKIQKLFRRFSVLINQKVVVPRSLRNFMRPGYLRGTNEIKFRNVLYEPWWAQTVIAEVLSFKLSYDAKLSLSGEAPLSLSLATASYHFLRWGSVEVAERFLHDLCLCASTYEQSVSRLKLFLQLLGGYVVDGLDSSVNLSSERALSLYIDLLLHIHKQISSSVNIGESDGNYKACVIATLFPITSCSRKLRRGYWLVPVKVLEKATREWSVSIKGVNAKVFTNLMQQLDLDAHGCIDVDDYMYLVMQQWSKLMHGYIKKCEEKLSWMERQELRNKVSVSATTTGQKQIKKKLLTLGTLGSLMETIYPKAKLGAKPEGGSGENETNIPQPDLVHYSKCYLQYLCLKSSSVNSMGLLLKSCALFDVNCGFKISQEAAISAANVMSSLREELNVLSPSSSSDSVSTNIDICIPSACGPKLNSSVVSGAPSSMSLAVSQMAWIQFRNIIVETMEELNSSQGDASAFASALATDADMDRKLQLVRRLQLRLDDIFYDTYSERESSIKPGAYVFSPSDLEDGADYTDDRMVFVSATQEKIEEIWRALQSIIGMFSEFIDAVKGPDAFPKDMWRKGRRLHLDKAKVYSVVIHGK